MAKIIYYSDENDELCYDIDHWYQHLEDEHISSIKLIEMEFDKDSDVRFCTLEDEFIDDGVCGKENCGKDYIPRNGVSGICVYKSYILKETKKKLTITTNTKFKRG